MQRSYDPASPECVKYTFTDISSAALFCSDQDTTIEVAATFADAGVRSSLAPSPAYTPAARTTSLTSTFAKHSSSNTQLNAMTSSPVSVPTSMAAGTSVAAGAPNPFTQSQASANSVGGVGTRTPTAQSGFGNNRGRTTLRGKVLWSALALWWACRIA
ncbi:MAG: hypothetical protein Q9217_005401 [Psora testacea]